MLKPIVLWGHAMGPNPWKVVMVFKELSLPYEHKYLEIRDMQTPAYEKINPNGRVPAIEDPNTGINLWESGAIIQYLVHTYDKENRVSYSSSPEKFYMEQWLYFQTSGQGPYFGQSAWFNHYHPEMIKTAQDRYKEQVKRVYKVLDSHLVGRKYLVGDKCTVADISFITWFTMVPWMFGDELQALELESTYPNWFAWNERLMARDAIKKTLAEHEKADGRHGE
ncbi:glutathione S-transferase [Halenospora varia]|nr:glutathione S-transferase [Halenospora varia]